MKLDIQNLRCLILPIALFILIVVVAIFLKQSRDWLLPVLFLLLPFVDSLWQVPRILREKCSKISWIILAVAITVLLFKNSHVIGLFITMVLIAALPEEWFFRAYLQKKLSNSTAAVLIVSFMFSLMHFITLNSVISALVFLPSVVFGYVYKKTGDLVLVVMLHALSNLVYYIYLESPLIKFIEQSYWF